MQLDIAEKLGVWFEHRKKDQ